MEMQLNEIDVNGTKYVKKDSVQQIHTGNVKICVLQRGWVLVGFFERDGNNCTLKKASVIRNWGTSKGLGELATGPTSTTKLDKCNGVVEFDYLTLVLSISCEESKWINAL